MTPEKGKFLAKQASCELVWIREWQVWGLKHVDASNFEGEGGGCFMSAGELRSLTFEQFTNRVRSCKPN